MSFDYFYLIKTTKDISPSYNKLFGVTRNPIALRINSIYVKDLKEFLSKKLHTAVTITFNIDNLTINHSIKSLSRDKVTELPSIIDEWNNFILNSEHINIQIEYTGWYRNFIYLKSYIEE